MFRILLAEDEQVMRAYLVQALERSGYEVVAVNRGTAAASLLDADHQSHINHRIFRLRPARRRVHAKSQGSG